MIDIEEALNKEADSWLQSNHTLMEWISHAMVEPSDELVKAYNDACPPLDDADAEEEYADELDEIIVSVYNNRR